MKRRLFMLVMALLLLARAAWAEGNPTTKAMLNESGRRIGVSQGSAAEEAVISNLQYLPERSEGMPFSNILYEEKPGILVKGDGDATLGSLLGSTGAGAEESEGESMPAYAAYNGKRLGVLTGSLMEDAAAEYFPDSEYLIFNSYPDCIAALLAGRSTPIWVTSRR